MRPLQPKPMTESLNAGVSIDTETTETTDGTIEVTDRKSDSHTFAKFADRLTGGELYAFCLAMYDQEGERMGNVKPFSTIYGTDRDEFPNRWIGQSADNPKGNWEDAESPLAFLYSRFGARDPKQSAKKLFYEQVEEETEHDPSDVTIEDYKASFPVRKALFLPESGSQEMVRIGNSPIESRQHKPWEDYYLPKEWVDTFGEEIPVYKGDEPEEEEQEQEAEETTEDEDMTRGNYANIGGTDEKESVDDELEARIRAVDTSGLNKKESMAAIASDVPETRGSLPDALRELLMEVTDASKTTVYKGQELFTESGDPRTEEEQDDEQTGTEETMEDNNDNNETEEVGKGTKILNLAVEHKPEEVLDLLMDANPGVVYEKTVQHFEEELEEEFGGEDKSEEEMVDDLFSGL